MNKKEYYKKYKEKIIDSYVKYIFNEYKKTFTESFYNIVLAIVGLLYIIFFPLLFIYLVTRKYYLRRKTWKKYLNGDKDVLKLIE